MKQSLVCINGESRGCLTRIKYRIRMCYAGTVRMLGGNFPQISQVNQLFRMAWIQSHQGTG